MTNGTEYGAIYTGGEIVASVEKIIQKMKNIKDYLQFPYTFITSYMEDETGSYYYGKVLELDGCQSTGDTIDELYENLKEAMEGWIETKLENGFDVPVPM